MKLNQLINLFAFLVILSLSLLAACNNSDNSTTAATDTTVKEDLPVRQLIFDKLVGTWKSESNRNFERWTKTEQGYRSDVFSITGSDTNWKEQATIYPQQEQWVYENTVKDQNDGKAIKFLSSILTEYTVQFSNPTHDFPTDVNYTLGGSDSIHAFIIGPNNQGGRDTIPFNYIRVSTN